MSVFFVTSKTTDPLPTPLEFRNVTKKLSEDAAQTQPSPAVTLTVPLPPPLENACEDGEIA
jgi:hypothetical protein